MSMTEKYYVIVRLNDVDYLTPNGSWSNSFAHAAQLTLNDARRYVEHGMTIHRVTVHTVVEPYDHK